MAASVLLLIGILITAIIVSDCINFFKQRGQAQPDATTCLGRLWNLMQAHDVKSVTLTDLCISEDGQITHCTVTVEHTSRGKIRRIEAPYFADFDDTVGGEPIVSAIERLNLRPEVMNSWRILVKVNP